MDLNPPLSHVVFDLHIGNQVKEELLDESVN